MDLRTASLALQSYTANKPATAPDPQGQGGGVLGRAAQDFAATLRESEGQAMTAMTSGADPHALVQALTQTELAVDTVVAVRDKVVQAYQEILRMPV